MTLAQSSSSGVAIRYIHPACGWR